MNADSIEVYSTYDPRDAFPTEVPPSKSDLTGTSKVCLFLSWPKSLKVFIVSLIPGSFLRAYFFSGFVSLGPLGLTVVLSAGF